MCILHGLTDVEFSVSSDQTPKVLNLDGITSYFGRWSHRAFDIGNTTSYALHPIKDGKLKRHDYTIPVFQQVKRCNMGSESNGCLMRITPLVVWAKDLPKEELYQAVRL